MSQAPVSNCVSHGILPENSTQALEISQFAYEASLAWGNTSNLQPEREEIPGADEDILGIKLPEFYSSNDLLLFVNSRWQLSSASYFRVHKE